MLVWLLLTIAGFAAASGAFGESLFARLNAGEATVSGEATDGRDILTAASTTGPGVSLIVQGADAADPVLAAPLTTAHADLLAIDGVAQVRRPAGRSGRAHLARRAAAAGQGRERLPGFRDAGTGPAR